MARISGFILSIYIVMAVTIISVVVAIVINSPYYSGFEGELIYLSPDLSENRTIIRDSIVIDKESKIKIVFEKKDNMIEYSEDQFRSFLSSLQVEVWNDFEYYNFRDKDIQFFNHNEDVSEITIGSINGQGKYYIYIKSNLGTNPSFHIGIGIGRESRIHPLGSNIRNFY